MSSSLKARLSYLQMEEVVLERECDRARVGIDRYTQILGESEAMLEEVRTSIINYRQVLDEVDSGS